MKAKMIPASQTQGILDFLKKEYIDQLAPIMLNMELQQYYSIKFDLLIFIYEFPTVGALFHEYASDFL